MGVSVMKGKVVMRFVGNRQEPEPDPEPLNFEGISVSLWPHGTVLYLPAIPKATLDYLERLMKQAEEDTLAYSFRNFVQKHRVGT